MDKRYNKVISLPGAIATRPKVLTDETISPVLTHDHEGMPFGIPGRVSRRAGNAGCSAAGYGPATARRELTNSHLRGQTSHNLQTRP
jgi:hypothetical protein